MGHLTTWDTFSVSKPKINLTKWDILLFETSPADVFITFQGESGFFFAEVGDNKTNESDHEEECEGEEEKEEITLSKALEMADKLKLYCPSKGIPDDHPQVTSIRSSGQNNEFYHQKHPVVS